VLAAFGAVVVLIVVAVLTWPVSLEKRVGRIHPGMTQAEVETVLGSPPGRFRTDGGITVLKHPVEGTLEWDWDDGFVVVQFDPAGLVKEAKLHQGSRPRPFFRRWLDQLGW
jgi:hypothetical protein